MTLGIDQVWLDMGFRVLGETGEKFCIEQGYIINLLEVNKEMDKWLFQGIDRRKKVCLDEFLTGSRSTNEFVS